MGTPTDGMGGGGGGGGVQAINRFIMSNASVTFTSCIFILQQCLPLKCSLCKEVSIGEYHVYTVLYCVCMNTDLLIHDHVASTLEHAERDSNL